MLNAGERLTKPHDLTGARWQVMGAIELEKRSLRVAQIARRMGLARQGVQRIINDLERLGMIALEDNVDHKRAKLVALTTLGKKAMAQIDKAQIAWVNQLSEDVSERQIRQALKLLQHLRARSEQLDINTVT